MSAPYVTVLQQSTDKFAPPGAPVLEVSVIGADVYLRVSTWEDTSDSTTLIKRGEDVQVPAWDLLNAIFAGMTALRPRAKPPTSPPEETP